jgi:hypothetical protein
MQSRVFVFGCSGGLYASTLARHEVSSKSRVFSVKSYESDEWETEPVKMLAALLTR